MKLRDLLELARVSNLPTVWSNAVLGWLAGLIAHAWIYPPSSGDPAIGQLRQLMIDDLPAVLGRRVAPIALLFSLLYTGGMALNDYLDRAVDAEERPSRPIPSGRVSPGLALGLAVGCMLLGLLGMAWFEWSYHAFEYEPWRATAIAAVLMVTIVMYNANHQKSAMTVLLMGMCRGLVVLSAAAVVQPPVMHWAWWLFVAGPAATLIAYTVAISLVARREVEHAAQPRRFGLLPRRFGGPKTVMNMIAAMPLLDAVWLVVMGLWPASLFCVACAGLTKLGHRKVAGS